MRQLASRTRARICPDTGTTRASAVVQAKKTPTIHSDTLMCEIDYSYQTWWSCEGSFVLQIAQTGPVVARCLEYNLGTLGAFRPVPGLGRTKSAGMHHPPRYQ